jgi:hypothetical protein
VVGAKWRLVARAGSGGQGVEEEMRDGLVGVGLVEDKKI